MALPNLTNEQKDHFEKHVAEIGPALHELAERIHNNVTMHHQLRADAANIPDRDPRRHLK
jgi:hypothetical protein